MTRPTHVACTSLALLLGACGHMRDAPDSHEPPPQQQLAKNAPRAELSIGYSLLYQEADGIPKLDWLLIFKDKSEEMGRVTNDLVEFYKQLADTLQRLSKEYPGMRIDAKPMSDVEAKTRKAIGIDLAKDLAPMTGKSGPDFEREALLTFYDSLNEQSHLVGVLLDMEPEPGLKHFLENTKTQLLARHAKVGALLERRYFAH